MAAPKGNDYWTRRSKDGREPDYNAETLWKVALEYFEWVKENPLWESVLVAKGIKINIGTEDETIVYQTALPKMRAMTKTAFCLFADITDQTFDNYHAQKDYLGVTTRIKQIIYSQKFEGAAAQMLNPNIIARDLGLSDKSEVTKVTLTESEREARIAELKDKFKE